MCAADNPRNVFSALAVLKKRFTRSKNKEERKSQKHLLPQNIQKATPPFEDSVAILL